MTGRIRPLFATAAALLLAAAIPALAASPGAAAAAGDAIAKPMFVPGHAAPGLVQPAATPSGYGPADLQSAYNLPSSTAGSGQTVAIVDAYDDPTAEADLGVYRAQYGLPACTTANGCFKKVNQTGGTKYPRTNAGWATEISLDLDMVSAVCPNCHILLVEASSASFSNLGTAVNEAAALHANAISNSYGGSDLSDSSAPYYNHPGIAITASSGDSGYGVQFPASSHYVTAVGGTSLTKSSASRGWAETVWSGAGSGCSTLNAALSGQSSFNTGCTLRAEADVSAVADPNTGVAVYDSTAYQGRSGWQVYGGTSVASPIIASVYALAGNTGSIDNNYPYTHSGSFFDVTSGSNGSCSPSQLCTARAGWDGPTGLGTPNGSGGF
ncbi:MAG: S8 family serine peptidase [Catenulispora sp.]|nr:S8 family serine peptidase [Catenulispora sp.]